MLDKRKNQKKEGMKINTSYQYLLDEVIKIFVDKYDYYELSDELSDTIKENDEIFSKKPIIPDLVIKNEFFDKNNCFYGLNLSKKNYFPRCEFKLDKMKLNNSIEKSKTSFCPNSDVMRNIFFKSDINDIKELLKGGNTEFNKEEENIIFNLINLNTIWFMKINGNDYKFNSFELFEFMTINILCQNKKLDDFIIYNNQAFGGFQGGYLYICLKKYLSSIFSNNNYNEYNFKNSLDKLEDFKINNTINNINDINNFNKYSKRNFMELENENINFGTKNP